MDILVRAVDVVKEFGGDRRLSRSLRDGFFSPRRSPLKTQKVLAGITLTVLAGDCIGITGPNGAGKSTLLRLIAGVSRATSGILDVRAKVAPLIAAGAGFHPEFTVRENVFLNGTILGARRRHLEKELPAILKFSDLEAEVDVPVKHLSTGQYVRLAFAIAVHTDCNLFLIDEILGVTDAEFREQVYLKIASLRSEKKAFVIVSHQAEILERLCRKVWTMRNGSLGAV